MDKPLVHPFPQRKRRKSMAVTYTLAVAWFLATVVFITLGRRVSAAFGVSCRTGVCLIDPAPSWPRPQPTVTPTPPPLHPKALDSSGLIALTKPSPFPSPTPYQVPDTDIYIDKYAHRYGKTAAQVNYIKQLMHCLIFRETGYDTNKGRGDNNRAAGPYQFWQDTWVGFRKLMIAQGWTDTIGVRENLEQATSTTAWAIANGHAGNWGPYLRRTCE